MENKEVVKYWLKTSKHDFDTMLGLCRIKRYSDCLFFGHIVLEKVLKALVVKATKKQAPRIHDLVRLHDLSKLGLSESDTGLLKDVNSFNIATRYPDFKLRFYRLCTREFADGYKKKIVVLYKKLCQKAK